MSRRGDDETMGRICYQNMKVLIQVGRHKTYLVRLLLEHARDHGFLVRYFKAPKYFLTILMDHVACWYEYVMNAFKEYHKTSDDEHKAVLNESVCVAMKFLVEHKIRHGVDALLEAVVFLPPGLMTTAALSHFVRYLCCPETHVDRLHSITASEDHVRTCWQGLRMYLTTGGPDRWDPVVLKAGLETARNLRSGVAAEVFLSPPYNVQPDADDYFSLAIVGALLVPGEAAVLATGRRFGKRQRGEEVEEETE
jgi:hypothetical protein